MSSVSDSPAESSTVPSSRYKFREKVLHRDHSCLITGTDNVDYLIASHIVAFAYWKELNKSMLPSSITQVIEGYGNKMNDVRNGLLLAE